MYCSTPSAALVDNDQQFDHSQSTFESIEGFSNFIVLNYSDDNDVGGCDVDDNRHSLGNLENGVDHSYYAEQINSLVAQCNQYQTVIKRHENEIDYYRKHIESLEDDFSCMSSSLATAEKAANNYKKKLANYEQTIDSLENELEHVHSKMFSAISSSPQSLSFTNEIDFKIDNYDRRNFTGSTTNGYKITDDDMDRLLLTLKEYYDENIEMKSKIESMQKEIDRLKKDNEDYRLQSLDCSNSKIKPSDDPHHSHNRVDRYKMSTPNKNFISYQALNISLNNTFSIDEDYECDNMIFDDNFKQFNFSTMAAANFECQQQNRQHFIDESLMNVSRLPSIDYIENEEMPSRMARGDDLSTVVGDTFTKILLSNSTCHSLSLCDISNIEDQKMPRSPIAGLDSTYFSIHSEPQTSAITMHGAQLTVYDMNGNYESQLENNDLDGNPGAELEPEKGRNFMKIKSIPLINRRIFIGKQLFISFFFLFYSTFLLNLQQKFRITKFRLIIILSIASIFGSYTWTRIKTIDRFGRQMIETRLIPFYSIEEIFIEIMTQSGFIDYLNPF